MTFLLRSLIVYTTFMSEYKMTDSQRFAIDKEHWEKWTQSYMDFIKESNNGKICYTSEKISE